MVNLLNQNYALKGENYEIKRYFKMSMTLNKIVGTQYGLCDLSCESCSV